MLRGVVSKGRKDNPEEHVPMASFVMTAYHFPVSHVIEPFSDDWNKVGVCWLCHSTQLHATAGSTRRYCSTTLYYSDTTLSYKVLLRITKYNSVLQSTGPVPQIITN